MSFKLDVAQHKPARQFIGSLRHLLQLSPSASWQTVSNKNSLLIVEKGAKGRVFSASTFLKINNNLPKTWRWCVGVCLYVFFSRVLSLSNWMKQALMKQYPSETRIHSHTQPACACVCVCMYKQIPLWLHPSLRTVEHWLVQWFYNHLGLTQIAVFVLGSVHTKFSSNLKAFQTRPAEKTNEAH